MNIYGRTVVLFATLFLAISLTSANPLEYVRSKRGAAYAGSHPGNGYGTGGVGIPGITNVIQYTAYNKLLNSGHQGGGGSSHGRKLTVDQAIGMFGHHTLNNNYPYTASHGSGGGGGGGSGYSGSSGGGGGGGYSR